REPSASSPYWECDPWGGRLLFWRNMLPEVKACTPSSPVRLLCLSQQIDEAIRKNSALLYELTTPVNYWHLGICRTVLDVMIIRCYVALPVRLSDEREG